MTGTDEKAPFPLEGGRVGDGGGGLSARASRAHKAPAATARARRFRREQTYAERLLWAEFRKLGMNFRRQTPIGPYVVDFAHLASRLVIEIDGYHHEAPERREADARRDTWFTSEGFRVLRIAEKRVRDDLFAVVDQIVAETAPPPSPTLPPSRGKGVKRYDIR